MRMVINKDNKIVFRTNGSDLTHRFIKAERKLQRKLKLKKEARMKIETTIYTDTEQKVTIGTFTETKDTILLTCSEVDEKGKGASFLTYLTYDEARQLAAILSHYSK